MFLVVVVRACALPSRLYANAFKYMFYVKTREREKTTENEGIPPDSRTQPLVELHVLREDDVSVVGGGSSSVRRLVVRLESGAENAQLGVDRGILPSLRRVEAALTVSSICLPRQTNNLGAVNVQGLLHHLATPATDDRQRLETCGNIQLLKVAGRGHASSGVVAYCLCGNGAGTSDGVACSNRRGPLDCEPGSKDKVALEEGSEVGGGGVLMGGTTERSEGVVQSPGRDSATCNSTGGACEDDTEEGLDFDSDSVREVERLWKNGKGPPSIRVTVTLGPRITLGGIGPPAFASLFESLSSIGALN